MVVDSGLGGFQWNPKYGCRGTVPTQFCSHSSRCLAVRCFDSTLRKLFVHPKYG